MDNVAGYLTIKTKIDNKDFTKQIQQTEKELQTLKQILAETEAMKPFKGQDEDIKNLELEIEKTTNKLAGLYDKQSKLTTASGGWNTIKEKISSGASKLGEMVKKIGKFGLGVLTANKHLKKTKDGISSTIKKIGKMALAIFGIRAAYGLVRSAVSQITQDNEQLQASINTIKSSLANALAPAINFIVGLLQKVLAYANAFVKALTGKDLLKKTANSAKDTAKAMDKTLANFDDINILQDKSSGGTSDSGVVDTTDYDSLIDKTGVLFQELMKIKDLLLSGDIAGLASTLSEDLVKGLDYFANKIKSIDWASIGLGISSFFTNIDFSGILVGLVTVFGEAVLGFQNMLLNIDFPTILANFSTGLANAIWKITEYLSLIDWNSIGILLTNTFTSIDWVGIGNSILDMLWQGLSGLLQLFLSIDWKQVGNTVSTAIKSWIENIITKFAETDWEQLGKDIVNAIFEFIRGVDWIGLAADIIAGLAMGIVSFASLIWGAFKEILKGILELFGIHSPSTVFAEMGVNMIKGLVNGLKSMLSTVINFFGDMWKKIKGKLSEMGTKAGEVVSNSFKSVINGILKAIENILNTPIKAVNSLIGTINKIPGINLSKLSTFSLPRLATGGIVDVPRTGVNIGGAIAGEKGAEAVIPLTSDEALNRIADAIGNRITLNIDLTNTIDGRVLNNRLETIKNNNSFSRNGG